MKIISIFAVLAIGVFAVQAQVQSVYTSTTTKSCKSLTRNTDETGSYEGECPGIGGYKLRLLEGDIRQSINVIHPNGAKSELNLWSVVSGAFSSIGEKIEWRYRTVKQKKVPFALIIRFNTDHEDPNSEKYRNIRTSYLVVARLDKTSACVTDIIEPTVKGQNAAARKLADASASKPCLTNE